MCSSCSCLQVSKLVQRCSLSFPDEMFADRNGDRCWWGDRCTCRWMGGWEDGQVDGKIGSGHAFGWVVGKKGSWTGRWLGGWEDGWVYGKMGGWTGRWVGGRADGWVDRQLGRWNINSKSILGVRYH